MSGTSGVGPKPPETVKEAIQTVGKVQAAQFASKTVTRALQEATKSSDAGKAE